MKKTFWIFAMMLLLGVSPVFAHEISQTALMDTWVNQIQPNTNYGSDVVLNAIATGVSQDGNVMLKFNNTLASGGDFVIYSITSCMNLTANNLDVGESVRVFANRIYPNYTCGAVDTWLESCPTWNTRPNSSYMLVSNASYQDFNSTSALGVYCWNLLPIFAGANLSAPFLSLYMNVSVLTGSPVGGDALFFSSREGVSPPYGVANYSYRPQWYGNATNSSGNIGEAVQHNLSWIPDEATMSHYIFSSNISGSFANETPQAFSGNISNFTKFVPFDNSTPATVVGWRFYANDTAGRSSASSVYSYVVSPITDFTADYPAFINESGNYSIRLNYTHHGNKIDNASVSVCYVYNPMFPPAEQVCGNASEDANGYEFNFSYDGSQGGLVFFDATAEKFPYISRNLSFHITLFDNVIGIRFWEDLNATEPYLNEFLWVYARPTCDLWTEVAYLGLLDLCNGTFYHARYSGGVANISIWSPNMYDLYVVDGSVSWDCTECEPVVNKYTIWAYFDTVSIGDSGYEEMDYYWNTTLYGQIPFTGDWDWDFWFSVGGIVILIIVAGVCAYYTENGIATLFIIILVYILLKLFGILTGAIFLIF